MKIRVVLTIILLAVSAAARAETGPEIQELLPPGAMITATKVADLTGDGRPELIIGYALPRSGRPPTQGRAVVLERTATGTFRRFDLPCCWPGHYRPDFRVLDLTGDGRPELVEQVAGGAAWQFLRVFRRAPKGYELLLEDAAQSHVLWDADGDGRQEVIARYRTRYQVDQALQRYRWVGDRFVAWHAPEWTYRDGRTNGGAVPDLKGLTLREADDTLAKVGLNLGVIAELDTPGQPGRILRFEARGGEVNVAVPAGDTSFRAPGLPPVAAVHYSSGQAPGIAPIAGTAGDRARWQAWLGRLAGGVEQVVHTKNLRSPAYFVELQEPWEVKLGGKAESFRWVGVGMEVPSWGLLFLGNELIRPGYLYPRFTVALYTRADLEPAPIPAEQPLVRYLEEHPEPDAFITLTPHEWAMAVRQRGIKAEGWPAKAVAPHLLGPAQPDERFWPVPDHALVTVLGGFVRRATRKDDNIYVEIVAAPKRVYRWILPLTGFNRSTKMVRVQLRMNGRVLATRSFPLEAWASWEGHPGPGSIPP